MAALKDKRKKLIKIIENLEKSLEDIEVVKVVEERKENFDINDAVQEKEIMDLLKDKES